MSESKSETKTDAAASHESEKSPTAQGTKKPEVIRVVNVNDTKGSMGDDRIPYQSHFMEAVLLHMIACLSDKPTTTIYVHAKTMDASATALAAKLAASFDADATELSTEGFSYVREQLSVAHEKTIWDPKTGEVARGVKSMHKLDPYEVYHMCKGVNAMSKDRFELWKAQHTMTKLSEADTTNTTMACCVSGFSLGASGASGTKALKSTLELLLQLVQLPFSAIGDWVYEHLSLFL